MGEWLAVSNDSEELIMQSVSEWGGWWWWFRIVTTSSMTCGSTVGTWCAWNVLWCLATQHTSLSQRLHVGEFTRRPDTVNQPVPPPPVRL